MHLFFFYFFFSFNTTCKFQVIPVCLFLLCCEGSNQLATRCSHNDTFREKPGCSVSPSVPPLSWAGALSSVPKLLHKPANHFVKRCKVHLCFAPVFLFLVIFTGVSSANQIRKIMYSLLMTLFSQQYGFKVTIQKFYVPKPYLSQGLSKTSADSLSVKKLTLKMILNEDLLPSKLLRACFDL